MLHALILILLRIIFSAAAVVVPRSGRDVIGMSVNENRIRMVWLLRIGTIATYTSF